MAVGICLSIFAVRCSTLSEDRAEFRYVPLYIADQVEQEELHIYTDFTYEEDFKTAFP